ncbi:MAG: sugar phosphate isomerase/epimerase [Armatimonadetes bacterium]|nr:sugar phosphate isomerase/epimerase [Armatimonadota bacterium]
MDLRLAVFTVQLYDLTPEEAAAELQRLGYDGVEWRVTNLPASIPANRNFWNGNVCTFEIDRIAEEAQRLRGLSEAHGLALPTLGTYLDCRRLDQVEACARAAKAIGVRMLRVGLPGWNHELPYDDAFVAARQAWSEAAAVVGQQGVKTLIELHHNSLLPTASAVRRFLDGHSPEQVGVIYDPGNMVHEGWEHPQIVIGVLGPYLAHVHVKNARWLAAGEEQGTARWRGEMCRLREGQVFWPDILAALQRSGYHGWFATEDFGPGDSREKLADNLAALRDWAARL